MVSLGEQWTDIFLNNSSIFLNDDHFSSDELMVNLLNDSFSSLSNEYSFRPNSFPIDEYQKYPSFDNTNDIVFSSCHSKDLNIGFSDLVNSNGMSSISFCSGEKNIGPTQENAPQNSDSYLFVEYSRKRSRTISSDNEIVKKRNVKTKNSRQSSKTSSCCCSDSSENVCTSSFNATSQSRSQSVSDDASLGKGNGSKGSASDPQSLYARKRREKINERLRTLQSLVPNGTKVDISTMLEEAVQYVKFLQLQIKVILQKGIRKMLTLHKVTHRRGTRHKVILHRRTLPLSIPLSMLLPLHNKTMLVAWKAVWLLCAVAAFLKRCFDGPGTGCLDKVLYYKSRSFFLLVPAYRNMILTWVFVSCF